MSRLELSPAPKRQRLGQPLEEDGLVIMLLDIEEEDAGRFCLWGRTADGRTALVQVGGCAPGYSSEGG
jgi:hypothetical protein